jgi:hypothetical protein
MSFAVGFSLGLSVGMSFAVGGTAERRSTGGISDVDQSAVSLMWKAVGAREAVRVGGRESFVWGDGEMGAENRIAILSVIREMVCCNVLRGYERVRVARLVGAVRRGVGVCAIRICTKCRRLGLGEAVETTAHKDVSIIRSDVDAKSRPGGRCAPVVEHGCKFGGGMLGGAVVRATVSHMRRDGDGGYKVKQGKILH